MVLLRKGRKVCRRGGGGRGGGVGGQHLHGAGCNGQRAENTWQGHPFAHITVLFIVNGAVHAGAAFMFAGDRTKLALQRVRCTESKIRIEGTCGCALSHSEDFELQVCRLATSMRLKHTAAARVTASFFAA